MMPSSFVQALQALSLDNVLRAVFDINPKEALKKFDLNEHEIDVIASRDSRRIQSLIYGAGKEAPPSIPNIMICIVRWGSYDTAIV
jgi:hypothetical protein